MVSRICIGNTWIYLEINRWGPPRQAKPATPQFIDRRWRGEFLGQCRRGRRLYECKLNIFPIACGGTNCYTKLYILDTNYSYE